MIITANLDGTVHAGLGVVQSFQGQDGPFVQYDFTGFAVGIRFGQTVVDQATYRPTAVDRPSHISSIDGGDGGVYAEPYHWSHWGKSFTGAVEVKRVRLNNGTAVGVGNTVGRSFECCEDDGAILSGMFIIRSRESAMDCYFFR